MAPAPLPLRDRVVLITGGCGGIGQAVAESCFAGGALVALTDLCLDAARRTALHIDASGGRILPLELDVTVETSVEAAVSAIAKHWGRIDVLVSNAGIQHIAATEALSLADWRRVMAVHLDGGFLLTRACLPHMHRQRYGRIIYMGSVHSKEASPLKAPYVTAKHGLLGLCRVVAKEGAPHNVAANVVCPGFVRTELVERQIPAQAARLGLSEADVVSKVMLHQTVDGAFTTTGEIAQAVLFLASFPTLALTGQSLVVSHGWHMA